MLIIYCLLNFMNVCYGAQDEQTGALADDGAQAPQAAVHASELVESLVTSARSTADLPSAIPFKRVALKGHFYDKIVDEEGRFLCFLCRLCGVFDSFNADDFKKHRLVHHTRQNASLFSCSYTPCNAQFTQVDFLAAHEERHRLNTPFVIKRYQESRS